MASPIVDIEGKYEILAKLGEGGMGAIYQVRHRLLDEVRVVKVLRQQHAEDSELRHRFAREARAAIRLRHPNVVQIFDFSVDEEGNGLIVMENIDGIDFEKLVRSRHTVSVPLGLEMARQALRSLGFLHQHGFVHRDVSPDNLMLTLDVDQRPLVKLIDLGIAKRVDAERQLTTRGSFLGKFRYASPEHFGASGHDGIEPRSDLYSFGLVFYELLTKQFPMPAETTSQLIAAHLMKPPRAFDETDPEGRLPDDVRSMVLRALSKAPDERYEDAEAWIRSIDGVRLRQGMDPGSGDDLAEEARNWLKEAPREEKQLAGDSTQGRLDHVFGMETTPKPASALDLEPAAATPGRDLDALVSGARTLFELGQTEAARRQIETLLSIEPDHHEASRLLEEFDAGAIVDELTEEMVEAEETEQEAEEPEEAEEHEEAGGTDPRLEAEITEIGGLIADSHLTEADRHIFQLAEEFGDSSALDAVRDRLQRAFDGDLKSELQALLDQAGAKVEDDDYAAALELIQKAEIMAPQGGESREKHLRGISDLKAEIESRERRRGLEQIERHVVRQIQTGRLAGLRAELERAKVSYGEADDGAQEVLNNLDRLVDRTLRDHLGCFVAEAGVALESDRFSAAVKHLREAVELAPQDAWIARQLSAAEEQLEEQRRKDENDASQVGRLFDESGARDEAESGEPPPRLVATLAEIEQLRQVGDEIAAWKQMLRALQRFGDIEVLLEARRSLAESILGRE